MEIGSAFDSARRMYEDLNERERRLVTVLGFVVAAIVVVLPLYLMGSAISDIEEENRKIADVLRDISRGRATLHEREAEREAAERRYARKAPPLGSFIEAKAQAEGLTVREVNDQPEKKLGKYTRRHTRVTLPGVGLRPVVEMMAAIENSPYPVAIERIQIEHFRSGDVYNVQLGVVAYDKETPAKKAKTPRAAKPSTGAGPPAP